MTGDTNLTGDQFLTGNIILTVAQLMTSIPILRVDTISAGAHTYFDRCNKTSVTNSTDVAILTGVTSLTNI